MSYSKEHNNSNDIAIIGLSGRFPGSDNVDQFWRNLEVGNEAITDIPPDRWDFAPIFKSGSDTSIVGSYSKRGGLLEKVDKFDARFFDMFSNEAEKIDPQQRIALEEAWKTFEDAGYAADQLSGRSIGVFVAARTGDYHNQVLGNYEDFDVNTIIGNDTSILSGRISHTLDLTGPSLAINSGCSSAGLAMYLACQSIENEESEMALAGGINIMSTPQRFLFHSKTGLMSNDGKCRAFDDSANGFVLGEAAGFFLLKKLKNAIRDNDNIYGVIKAIGIRHGGKTKGLTIPNSKSLYELIKRVNRKSKIDASSITYYEAHCTGTKKGDASELNAIIDAFKLDTEEKKYCALGSVKSNIGYSLIASVIPGVFKILLAMKYRTIPPTINVKKETSLVDFKESPFYLPKKSKKWSVKKNLKRRAAISSLSYSGTNFYMLLEEPPEKTPVSYKKKKDEYHLIPFSAKNEEALRREIKQMLEWLKFNNESQEIGDFASTLIHGRVHFDCRVAFVVKDFKDLMKQLSSFLGKNGQGKALSRSKNKSHENT